MKISNIISIILIVIAIYIGVSFFKKDAPKTEIKVEHSAANIEPLKTSSVIDIPINPLLELSYKSKEEIYKLRENALNFSIFKNAAYKPSEEIFGEIVSAKPWIANDVCKDRVTNAMKITGVSEESRFINNPALLVAIEYPFSFSDIEDKAWCTSNITTLIPVKITYNGGLNQIEVTYEKLPFTTASNSSFYNFNGLNARDLGYKWAYIDKDKSSYDIEFSNPENISTQPVEFQNFLHLGSSCGREEGCNNGSPRQPLLEFKENRTRYTQQNKEIYLKLWKNSPSSPSDPPDITEKIILKQS